MFEIPTNMRPMNIGPYLNFIIFFIPNVFFRLQVWSLPSNSSWLDKWRKPRRRQMDATWIYLMMWQKF